MLQAYGLQSHIRSNRIKTGIVLVIFPFVLPAIIFIGAIAIGIAVKAPADLLLQQATVYTVMIGFVVVPLMVLWVPIGYVLNQWIIDRATGAKDISPGEEPRVWELMDNLCKKGGLRTPKLRVIEAEELNAFASGVSERSYAVTVTRGLMETLDDDELEAVIGHELTHIKNRDVQLTIATSIIAGVAPLACDLILLIWRIFMWAMFLPFRAIGAIVPGFGAIIALQNAVQNAAFALCTFCLRCISGFFSVLLNMFVSRKREFMADAGAVELTGNPEGMMSALSKISGRSNLPTSVDGVRQMYFDNALGGLFATHPPIESRIQALAQHARSVPATRAPRKQQEVASPPNPGRRFDANYEVFLRDQLARGQAQSKEDRFQIYKSVSSVFIKQLENCEPALSDSEWNAEQAAFRAAVERIETAPEQTPQPSFVSQVERLVPNEERRSHTPLKVLPVAAVVIALAGFAWWQIGAPDSLSAFSQLTQSPTFASPSSSALPDPYAYCRVNINNDMPVLLKGPSVPESIVRSMQSNNVRWRCMDGHELACNASLSNCSKSPGGSDLSIIDERGYWKSGWRALS